MVHVAKRKSLHRKSVRCKTLVWYQSLLLYWRVCPSAAVNSSIDASGQVRHQEATQPLCKPP